jgi:hypothetical protein
MTRSGWMRATLAVAVLAWPALSLAQGFFLPTEDFRLREDLGLLVDEDVIRLPVNTWPLPAQDVRLAIRAVRVDEIHEPALRAAFARVRANVAVREHDAEWRLQEIRATAGEPGLLRMDDTLGRENGELRSMGGVKNDRWSMTIALTGAINPQDDKEWRLDGSELSIRWGNWLFSANQIDRWWGPGHGGGIILSSNARPMPGVSLDRIQSTPWDLPVLRWLGPWRFSMYFAAMERERADIDHPLFMGMRFAFKPVSILEIGLSRTAQFCGEDRPCDLETFFNVIFGNDNVGIRVEPGEEPGNQMAGIDMRLVSPFQSLPIALYTELIGEDGSDTRTPERYLAQFGAEAWWSTDSGSTWRTRLEYASTFCKWDRPEWGPDCAYHQALFWAGYRYHGRNIGHTTDGDSQTWMLQMFRTSLDGERWGLVLRHGTLDSLGTPDPWNLVTYGPSDYNSLELSWNGLLWGQDFGIQLGYQDQDGTYVNNSGAFGFIQWRKPL